MADAGGTSTTAAADADLYERDFAAWAEREAAMLREAAATSDLPLDWANLAEEIADLGKWQARELGNRLSTIVEHLLKLRHSPADDPRAGWQETVDRSRVEAEAVLEENPSLRPRLGDAMARARRDGARLAAIGLKRYGELAPGLARRMAEDAEAITAERALDPDWWPERAAATFPGVPGERRRP